MNHNKTPDSADDHFQPQLFSTPESPESHESPESPEVPKSPDAGGVRLRSALDTHQVLSKEHQAFYRLIQTIEEGKENLLRLQELGRYTQAQWQNKSEDVHKKHWQSTLNLALHLDQILSTPAKKTIGKKVRQRLIEHLEDIVATLNEINSNDTEVAALTAKYFSFKKKSDNSPPETLPKNMVEEMLGEHYEEGDERLSGEALAEKIQRAIEMEEGEDWNQNAREESRSNRKKNKKQQIAEEAKLEAEKLMGQTVREVYRKLVTALHPDRETNAEVRAQKTELMQRINVAYQKNDLLSLLTLQLETQQIDEGHIQSLPDSQIKLFNQILKEQVATINDEIQNLQAQFHQQFNQAQFPFHGRKRLKPLALTPKKINELVQESFAEFEIVIEQMQYATKYLDQATALADFLDQSFSDGFDDDDVNLANLDEEELMRQQMVDAMSALFKANAMAKKRPAKKKPKKSTPSG